MTAIRDPGGFSVAKVIIPQFEITAPGKIIFFKVGVRPTKGRAHFVSKRFSQFVELDKRIQLSMPLIELPALPPKRPRFLGGQSPEFLEERRILLEHYLASCVASSAIQKSVIFLTFLSTDKCGQVSLGEGQDADSIMFNEENDVFPEYQEVRHISIPQAKIMADHVLYQIHCSSQRDPLREARHSHTHWVSLKRFTDFLTMMRNLRQELSIYSPLALNRLPIAAPTRKSRVLHDHTDPVFVEHRRILLQYYLNKLLRIEHAASSDTFLKFCAVPGV